MERAVIFDFDGVLVDSEPLHEWAIASSIADRGWTFEHDQFVRHIVGRGDENAYRRIAEWNGGMLDEAQIRTVLERKWMLMREGIEAGRFTVQPGADAAMRMAKQRGPVAVCSGSVRSTVEPMLRKIGLLGLLDALVCGDDVVRMKPDPEGYLLAAKNVNTEPGACVAIEDTPTGVKAAKAAGMRVIAVCHTVPAEMLREADEIVPRISGVKLA